MPKHENQKPGKYRITESDGNQYEIEIKIVDNQPILQTPKQIDKLQYNYIFENLKYPKEYNYIYISPSCVYDNLADIKQKYKSFIVVYDLSNYMLPWINKPKNSIISSYTTTTYKNYKNINDKTFLYYYYDGNKYYEFNGFFKLQNNTTKIIMPPEFYFINNYSGYFYINSICIFLVSKHVLVSAGEPIIGEKKYQLLPFSTPNSEDFVNLLSVFEDFTPKIQSGEIQYEGKNYFFMLGITNAVTLFCGVPPYFPQLGKLLL